MAKKSDKDRDNLAAALDKIPQIFGDQAAIGMRLHELILSAAPELKPRLWYGMPGYAKSRTQPVLVFIRRDDYLTFGITEKAKIVLAPGATDQLIPSSWFMRELDEATEARIAEIVRVAVG
ncbi:MAG: DUF1801 domain-containing protein [Chloroflexi bacterium]|nr:DUF1801 domain-containing protein [Chloroflexota bacterium]MCY3581839.1 DUF1801 domain-containing protein [Chloroflexota bacterium]MCY3716485.1 DUF1801 domain-containing protein [Chloroflexota bacterium]MDE2651579.1 DUF1801 domain-containing protein [Chloroflexota bacterium]MXX51742.1 DUF1801 domain-containing protein [Chloroflexota bacterium]